LRRFTDLQEDLQVNYCKLAVISTDPPEMSAAFRTGLAATFTFLSDHERQAIRQLDIVEMTPPDFKYGLVALPFTFSLAPDLTIHTIYDGWWFVGRPTLEELHQDMRALMQAHRKDYHYSGPSLSSVERESPTPPLV
jgi:peroxiredoxin